MGHASCCGQSSARITFHNGGREPPVLVHVAEVVLVAALEVPEVALPEADEHGALTALGEELVVLLEALALRVALEHGGVARRARDGLVRVRGREHDPEVEVAEHEQMRGVVQRRRSICHRERGKEQRADDAPPVAQPRAQVVVVRGQVRGHEATCQVERQSQHTYQKCLIALRICFPNAAVHTLDAEADADGALVAHAAREAAAGPLRLDVDDARGEDVVAHVHEQRDADVRDLRDERVALAVRRVPLELGLDQLVAGREHLLSETGHCAGPSEGIVLMDRWGTHGPGRAAAAPGSRRR
jgi:hypothetical protein